MSATVELMTFADVIDHLVDFNRANPSATHAAQIRRAIFLAYDNFANDHQWPYFYTQGRICTDSPYQEGQVSYDKSGGSIERQLTLTGGTWPENAAFGQVIIGQVIYDVADRFNDTVLQLDIDLSPVADISTSSYTWMRNQYPAPVDLRNIDKFYTPESWHRIEYVHPREWMVAHRYNITSSNTPQWYTIIGSRDYMGALSIAFYPFPDSQVTVDFIYQRRPRPLRVERVQGTLNASTGDINANYVDGTAFSSRQIGGTIRLTESSGLEFPTGREGENPYSEERIVMTVNDAGDQIEVDQQFLQQHSNSKFVISDPVDLEPGVMKSIFLRRCEMELALLTRMQDRQVLLQDYHQFLERHKSYASRTRSPRSVYTEGLYNRRLAFMPSGPDVD